MFISTFVTVPVISLFIFTMMVGDFLPPQMNTKVEDCAPSFFGATYLSILWYMGKTDLK